MECKGSLVHGLTASKTIWELCGNLGFQTGGPWQEAGEDGQDSEHLLPGVGVCMEMCPVGEGWRGRSVCSWHERTVSIGVHTQGADGEI